MNPESGNFTPLTLDESIRLAAYLAEHGYPDAAFAVLGGAASVAVVAAMSEAAAR